MSRIVEFDVPLHAQTSAVVRVAITDTGDPIANLVAAARAARRRVPILSADAWMQPRDAVPNYEAILGYEHAMNRPAASPEEGE